LELCGQTISGITGVFHLFRLKLSRTIHVSRSERETDSTLATIISR
jgi:hypothetical protein